MTEKPNYYAIIPANVRYSQIPAGAKLLYGELTALTSREGYCWSTNKYFAELYDVHQNSVVLWLGFLQKEGFIRMEVDKSAGNKRRIWILNDKFGIPLSQKTVIAITKNIVHSINNTSNTKGEDESSQIVEVAISEDGDARDIAAKREKADTSYKTIFALWGKYPKNWLLNKTQIQAAKNLLEEHKIEQIRGALKFHSENSEHTYCPTILSPYDLDSKWNKLIAFKRKYG